MSKLNAKKRNALPSSKFAGPDGKLPINDAAHARNAAARFNQTKGMSPAEKASAKRKIVAAEKRFGVKNPKLGKK